MFSITLHYTITLSTNYVVTNPPYNYEAYGIDISKAAIKAAAGAGGNIGAVGSKKDNNNNTDNNCATSSDSESSTCTTTWIVGSTRLLPFDDGFADVQLCSFFNPDWDAVLPKLKPKGNLIVVSPTDHHLKELREIIYGPTLRTRKKTQQQQPQPPVSSSASVLSFSQLVAPVPSQQTRVDYQFTLHSRERIQDLLTMTPHYWRATKEAKQRLSNVSLPLSMTCSVTVAVFIRK